MNEPLSEYKPPRLSHGFSALAWRRRCASPPLPPRSTSPAPHAWYDRGKLNRRDTMCSKVRFLARARCAPLSSAYALVDSGERPTPPLHLALTSLHLATSPLIISTSNLTYIPHSPATSTQIKISSTSSSTSTFTSTITSIPLSPPPPPHHFHLHLRYRNSQSVALGVHRAFVLFVCAFARV